MSYDFAGATRSNCGTKKVWDQDVQDPEVQD
jgi:hypothetical protein